MSALPKRTPGQPLGPTDAGDRPALTLFAPQQTASEPPTRVDLAELLGAWKTATERLERTHSLLSEEVARLTAELEVKNRELARRNRMAVLGEMASHVAHEVRNSLTPVTLYLSLLRRRVAADAEALQTLGKAESGLTALEATVNDLLSLSANRRPQWASFLLGDLVTEIVESLAPQFEAQAVDTEIDIPPNTVMVADREMIRRAVLNLVLNALDVMPRGGELVVTSYQGSGGVEIEVADSGPGLSDEQQKRAFEPFYTTKETGTGLGLSVVAHVAEAHGGRVTAANCPEGGAAFTLRIPRRAGRAA